MARDLRIVHDVFADLLECPFNYDGTECRASEAGIICPDNWADINRGQPARPPAACPLLKHKQVCVMHKAEA